jgi:hypothetical protein
LQKDTRDFWPVYDVVERAVSVLPITGNLRTNSLRTQLHPVLQRLKNDDDRLLITRSQPSRAGAASRLGCRILAGFHPRR